MLEKCPKINKSCIFCGKTRYNRKTGKWDGEEKLYCGAASTTAPVNQLPDCWKNMSKHQRRKFKAWLI